MSETKTHSRRRRFRPAVHFSVGSTAGRRDGPVRTEEAGARLGRDRRSCPSDSRIASARRIFSGHDKAFRRFCHCAAFSRRLRASLIDEPRFEPSPGLRQSVLRRKARDLVRRRGGGLEQSEDASVILCAPDARLRIAHLHHRPEQGVVLDHARGLPLVEKLRQLLHRAKLSYRTVLERGSQVGAILGSARLLATRAIPHTKSSWPFLTKVGTFTQALYDEAKKRGWTVISMKNDWKRVFAFE